MGVMQAVKNGFTLIANNLKLYAFFVGVSVVAALITLPFIIGAFGTAVFQAGAKPSPEVFENINWGLFALFIIFSIVFQTFINGGIMGVIRDVVKTNNFVIGDFLKHARHFFVRFILFSLALLGIGILAAVVMAALGMITAFIGNAVAVLGGLLGAVLFLAFAAAMLFLVLYGIVVNVAIVADDKNLQASMGMGFRFVKEKLWKVLGLALIFLGMFFVIGLINRFLSDQGGVIAVLSMIVVGLINIYLSLAFPAGFMSFYLGNTADAPPSAMQTGQA